MLRPAGRERKSYCKGQRHAPAPLSGRTFQQHRGGHHSDVGCRRRIRGKRNKPFSACPPAERELLQDFFRGRSSYRRGQKKTVSVPRQTGQAFDILTTSPTSSLAGTPTSKAHAVYPLRWAPCLNRKKNELGGSVVVRGITVRPNLSRTSLFCFFWNVCYTPPAAGELWAIQQVGGLCASVAVHNPQA